MSRMLFSLLAGIGLAATALVPAAAQAIPSGSYQQSCTNVRVRGDQLIARCTNAQGVYVRSSIALDSCRGGDIANSNGQLVCNGGYHRHGRHGGYDNGRHNGDYNNGGYNNGGYNNGGYNNGGYNNGGYNNGRYNGSGYAPGGSYQSSCTNASMNGRILTATCTAPNGGSYTSSINVQRCRGMDIANVNGRLACR